VTNLPRYREALPVHTIIVELLDKNQGALTDTELYKALKDLYEDINYEALNKSLMKLEIEGIIQVTSLTKAKKRIELIRKTWKKEGAS